MAAAASEIAVSTHLLTPMETLESGEHVLLEPMVANKKLDSLKSESSISSSNNVPRKVEVTFSHAVEMPNSSSNPSCRLLKNVGISHHHHHHHHHSHKTPSPTAPASSSTQTHLTVNTGTGSRTPALLSPGPTVCLSSKFSGQSTSCGTSAVTIEVTDPKRLLNEYIWRKLESVIERMQSETAGVVVKNYKSFMKFIPSVFTANNLMQWLEQWLHIDDRAEAQHVASMLAAMGYLFPIDDHVLAVRNEHQLMRYQTPCLYPSRAPEADEMEYAVYLCKRTMQNKLRLELADYEAERLARLQSLFCHKWEFVYMQAEAEAKVDKKRDKSERQVLESQERAYWDLFRPAPGSVNMTEVDMRKLCRAKRPKKVPVRHSSFPLPSTANVNSLLNCLDALRLPERVSKLKNALSKSRVKVSKAVENLLNFYEQYGEFDLLLNASTMQVVSSGSGSNIGAVSGEYNTPAHSALPVASSAIASQQPLPCSPNTPYSTALLPASVNGNMPNNADTSGPAVSSDNSNNPWVCDNQAFWEGERRIRDLPIRRVKRWAFGIQELLRDVAGREEFLRWLEKEFSAENLRFYQACQDLKGAPLREVGRRIESIYEQFLSPNAAEPLNVDSRVAESVRRRVGNSTSTHPDRYCFEEAEEHIFHLMKSDSYCRFLRSEVYKDLLAGQKKKSKKKFASDMRQKPDLD